MSWKNSARLTLCSGFAQDGPAFLILNWPYLFASLPWHCSGYFIHFYMLHYRAALQLQWQRFLFFSGTLPYITHNCLYLDERILFLACLLCPLISLFKDISVLSKTKFLWTAIRFNYSPFYLPSSYDSYHVFLSPSDYEDSHLQIQKRQTCSQVGSIVFTASLV